MDSWERFDGNHYQIKKIYSELNLKEITDKDYMHGQKVFEEFKSKNLSDYHDACRCVWKL